VGSYAINGSGLTANNGNYVFAQAAGNATAFTINPAIIALNGTRSFDATTNFAAAVFGAAGTIAGVNGETLTLTGAGSVANPKVATYALTTGTLALANGTGLASNYTLAGGAHSGTITPSASFGFSWTSGSNLQWDLGANWNQGVAPVNGSQATIPAGLPGAVVYSGLSGTTSLASLVSGSGLTVSGGVLNLGTSAADISSFSGRPLTLAGGKLGGGGTLNMIGTTLDVLAGGTLGGNRSIVGDVNNLGGTVAAGASDGILTINGNYVQGATGTLLVQLSGTTPGTQYDQLVVSGNAALDGVLRVDFLNNFVPPNGQTFNIVQAGAVTGRFSNAVSFNIAQLGAAPGSVTNSVTPVTTPLTTVYQPSLVEFSAGVPADPSLNTVIYQINNSTAGLRGTVALNSTQVASGTSSSDRFINLDTGESVIMGVDANPSPGTYVSSDFSSVVVVSANKSGTGSPTIRLTTPPGSCR
jgi:hypothetical protein